MFSFSICFIGFVFLFFSGIFLFVSGFYFVLNDLVHFVEWDNVTLNSSSIVMSFLFDWMSLVFMGFVFFLFLH